METKDWQTELSSVRERNLYAFNKSFFCDVEFTVLDSNGDKATLQAHKYVLAISSPVFEAMFYGELAETGRTIDLPDCSKEGLQELLRYVYSDEVHLTGSNVMSVIYVAEKYMMPFLTEKCYEFLQKDLQPEEVFIVLPHAQQSKVEKAVQCCWNIVDFETQRAVTSEPFLGISRDILCQLLSRDTLHVDEIDLFQAVDSWALNQIQEKSLEDDGTTKRAVLGDEAIRLIRFPVMTQQEFAAFVLDSNILNGSEVNDIVKVFSSEVPPEKGFNTKKREGQWSEKWSANRFLSFKGYNCKYTKSFHTPHEHQHCLQLKVSKPVFLAGVRLFGEKTQVKTITLKIIRGSSSFCSGSFRHVYTDLSLPNCKPELMDELYHGFTVIFDDPVPLEPDQWYSIEAKWSENGSSCTLFGGSEGQSVIKCDDIIITFKSAAEKNCTTVRKGQFSSFLFKRKIELKKK